MSDRDSGRRYTVTQRNGSGKTITESKHENPEAALGQFRRSLQDAGYAEAGVAHFSDVLTATLMRGARGYEVLDPDFKGSTSITITTK